MPWYLLGRRIRLAGAAATGLELRLLRETETGASSAPVASAYDKAAKKGDLKRGMADRKKSRLTIALNKLS